MYTLFQVCLSRQIPLNYTKIINRNLHRTRICFNTNATKLKTSLLTPLHCEKPPKPKRVTVVGAGGLLGASISYNLFLKNVCDELILTDVGDDNANSVCGEALDLLHGTTITNSPHIRISKDLGKTEKSDVVILTCGAPVKTGQCALDTLGANAKMFNQIVPTLAKLSPEGIFIVVTNPVDLLTYLTWKASKLDFYKIIGIGTQLDTIRFRFLISKKFDVAPQAIGGWIIGEHGDNSVPVWSSVAIGGTRLRDVDANIATKLEPENWLELHDQVLKTRQVVGSSPWSKAIIVHELVSAICKDTRSIHAVSTKICGHHGADSEVFLSLPCVIGSQGITEVVSLYLTDEEREQFKMCHDKMFELANKLGA